MGLEAATYVNDLNTANPVTGDQRNEGDDHLRMIKATLKATFPGMGGAFTRISTVSGAQSVAATDNTKLWYFTGNGTLNLPLAASAGNGFMVLAYVPARVSVVVDPSGAETVNSVATVTFTDCLLFVFSNGTSWAAAAVPKGGNTTPIGTILAYGGTTAPSGWLFCYGQAISRTTYAALFDIIATNYGVGDGSTTFNLPDLRGRVIAGKDDMGGSSANRLTSPINGDTMGAVGGTESHTLTEAQLPVHTHAPTVSDTHTHNINMYGSPGGVPAVVGNSTGGGVGTAATTGTAGGSIGVTIANTGSGSAHNNVQPTLIGTYMIRAE